uniref:magnesium-protoporphyrin IX monomethyl ester (oxidative) cyclase n=1 Tax=Choristocarpus tenellus TaxID=116065 RepID=UPI002E773B62|nr:magnesium-protoporphyrin IX monomethyl ester (oxidative) cyclase [Choristocarpus tenellus]WAM62388.1 magnesium-protoporphyrin IX monomethyl ester (oxidative) cyclase [Choristocarpus tenellus]
MSINDRYNKNDVTIQKDSQETILAPRFYTTDFEEMANLNIESNKLELQAVLREFEFDYNKDHFVRDKEFKKPWLNIFDYETRRLFIGFLQRSCTAEFSGFLLYKELSRALREKNPLLADGFAYMSRDEARHAGFLNKSMSDFNVTLDLGFLTKNRKYTFFPVKFILYATFLSERIGYCRYITIYRHLEKNSKYRIYPIFKFFESWCQDENRHADFFAAVLRSQPHLLTTLESKLWCRFFLLSVFITMYINDLQRANFYATIGLDAIKFDVFVIKKTNEFSGRLFPVILDLKHPKFYTYLNRLVKINKELLEIDLLKKYFNDSFKYINYIFFKFNSKK